MQGEQELPIDIHSNKLLDWLVSRRHCPRDYTNEVLAIREKINVAIQDMPAVDEITKLLSGAYINYFHCLQIVELLKETESQSKNIFGRYSSQRMKDWQEIVKQYQKDNVYLAEAAQMLIRNVNFEVPSLKRQVVNLRHLQTEYEKKHTDCVKSAKDVKDKYYQSCKRLGIAGNDIRKELLEALKDLPVSHKNVLNSCKGLSDIKTYYHDFVEYALGRRPENSDAELPMTTYLLQKGNTTVYEWKFGEPPTKIEGGESELAQNTNETSDEIDFGGDSIDFGGDSIDFGTNEIDFGTSDEIDFGTDVDADSTQDKPAMIKPSDGVARGENALSILDDNKTRTIFMNELFELESFLDQRLIEMRAESNQLSVNQFQNAPASLQTQSPESVAPMLTSVCNIINFLNDAKLQQLFLIKASPRYIDRLCDSLKQQLSISERMVAKSEDMDRKRREALAEELSLEPKIDLIINKTRVLQKEIESDISAKYNKRVVNIMGGINTL